MRGTWSDFHDLQCLEIRFPVRMLRSEINPVGLPGGGGEVSTLKYSRGPFYLTRPDLKRNCLLELIPTRFYAGPTSLQEVNRNTYLVVFENLR